MSQFLRVHCGAVVAPSGGAILILGEKGAGKTTIVTRLLLDGFDFVSDDVVLIDVNSLRVHPSGRNIFLKDNAPELFPTLANHFQPEPGNRPMWWLDPREVRNCCIVDEIPVSILIILSDRFQGDTCLEPIGQVEALRGLLSQCMDFPEHGAKGFEVLSRLVERCRSYRANSIDLEEIVRLIRSLL